MGRWRAIKGRFSRALVKAGVPLKHVGRGEYDLWFRRFWEHSIRFWFRWQGESVVKEPVLKRLRGLIEHAELAQARERTLQRMAFDFESAPHALVPEARETRFARLPHAPGDWFAELGRAGRILQATDCASSSTARCLPAQQALAAHAG